MEAQGNPKERPGERSGAARPTRTTPPRSGTTPAASPTATSSRAKGKSGATATGRSKRQGTVTPLAKPTVLPGPTATTITTLATSPARRARPRPPTAKAIRSISHDIRNLLTAVRGHAELALRGLAADDPVREDVAHVVVVTASVFEMVDLLDGAPASDAQLSTDLDLTVSGMRRLLDALLPDHVLLEIATSSERSRVPLSRLRIERIVLNLVMNARDAMPDGGRLVVTTRRLPDELAELTIADTGPGFSDDALAHLFVEGFTTKGDRGGSGRGLAAIHTIVRDAGGAVEVESVPGEGARIVIRLPFAEPIGI
jgi:signal transduction histidine kinase